MATSHVVTALMLHNQMCKHCFLGEPCLMAERIHDEWTHQSAPSPFRDLPPVLSQAMVLVQYAA